MEAAVDLQYTSSSGLQIYMHVQQYESSMVILPYLFLLWISAPAHPLTSLISHL